MEFGTLANLWNKVYYGWDLNTLNTDYSLFIDVSHWTTTKAQFSKDLFAEYVETKNLKGLIFKVSDANRTTGYQYYDDLSEFWYELAMEFKLHTTGYHWLQYSVDPKVAWNFYYAFMKDHPPTLPYVVDWEESSVSSSSMASDYIWRLQNFLSYSGEDTIIYTARWYINKIKALMSSSSWNTKLSWMSAYPLWCAWYSRIFPTKDSTAQWPWDDFVGWQYSDVADYPYYTDEDSLNGTEMGGTSKGLDMNWFRNDFLADYPLDSSANIPNEETNTGENMPEENDETAINSLKYSPLYNMNIRNAPSVFGSKVGSLDQGCVVSPIDIGGSDCWIEIEPDQWVCKSLNGKEYLVQEE